MRAGTRDFAFERDEFAAGLSTSKAFAVDVPWDFVVRIASVPSYQWSAEPGGAEAIPWSEHVVHVPMQVDAPIEGRVVDAQGVAVGGARLQIVHLFPEAFDPNSFMVLADEPVRALGGFSAAVVAAKDGRFTLRGVAARGGDPFLVREADQSLRVSVPKGITWTSPGGTWVDVVVAKTR